MQALLLERMGQRTHDMFLPDQGFEAARAPFSRENLVAHGQGF